MAWDSVIDQPRVLETLQRAISSQRVAHAYLFHGPDGSGKRAAALAFAQALQCAEGGPEPCGACSGCRKVQRLIHPDVHVMMPYPRGTDTEDVAQRIQRLAEHPYAAVDFVRRPSLDDPTKSSNKQVMYHVDRVNDDLRRSMSYKPLEGRYKFVLLLDADLMRPEAANAFLKLLEEPGDRTVFVLTTKRPDRLLPTILSRCQRLRFDPLSADGLAAALSDRDDVPADTAATYARMADGSYTRALDLLENDDLMAHRAMVIDYMRYAYVRDLDKLADLAEEIQRLGRERVKGLLRLLLSWIRDLVLYHTMGADAPLVNVDQAEAIARFCSNLPDADLEAMVDLVEDALDLVQRNVQIGLTMMTLAAALGRAMRGSHSGRLYVPLADPVAPFVV
jgi:DNA polymerase III subunit delta'